MSLEKVTNESFKKVGDVTIRFLEIIVFHVCKKANLFRTFSGREYSRLIGPLVYCCCLYKRNSLSQIYRRQEKVPNMAPAAIPTANPIMKPILTRSTQLGWVWPYGPTATGIWRGKRKREREEGRRVREEGDGFNKTHSWRKTLSIS